MTPDEPTPDTVSAPTTDRASETISSDRRYEGRVFSVSVDRVRLPHGPEVSLEVVHHAPSVVLLPMPTATSVILVRQYRHAVQAWMWELPAGSVDPGETAEAAAVRECHEEVGLVPESCEHLGAFYPTPGYCTELMNFFRLGDLRSPSTPAEVDEDEHLLPKAFTFDEVDELIARGEIRDMKTVTGLSLVRQGR